MTYVWQGGFGFDNKVPNTVDTFYSPWPVLGFRYLKYFNGEFAGAYGGDWSTGMFQATCNIRNHDAPRLHCNCGIYALKEPPSFTQLLTLVAMHGVIEHDLGYRARRAWVIGVTQGEQDFNPRPHLIYRQQMLISNVWITDPVFCRSSVKLTRVADYMSKHPEEIPVPNDKDWEAHFAYHKIARPPDDDGNATTWANIPF